MLEKNMEFELVLELPWKRRHEFLVLNPAGTVPVLVTEESDRICGAAPISEYLEELDTTPNLLGQDIKTRAEVRRLVEWFDLKFKREVTDLVVDEKVMKRFLKRGTADPSVLRYASQNMKHHLQYIEYLADRRNWLAGNDFSYADISAAAHLSCVDYFGDVPWDDYKLARDWYARIKSRPSMQIILKDHITGLLPVPHYKDPDF